MAGVMRRRASAQTHAEGQLWETEAEMGAMLPQAKTPPGLPAASGTRRGGRLLPGVSPPAPCRLLASGTPRGQSSVGPPTSLCTLSRQPWEAHAPLFSANAASSPLSPTGLLGPKARGPTSW